MHAAALVDAGPLIAFFDADDARHKQAVESFEKIAERPVTTWPVLTEAAYMLGKVSVMFQLRLLAKVAEGALTVAPLESSDVPRLIELMGKYRDRRMDLADATLLRVAERERIRTVVTFDRRDFGVYRADGIGALKVIP